MTAIRQEGRGALSLDTAVPHSLTRYIIPASLPKVIRGHGFQTLMQEFRGDGFSAWFNRMFARERTVITIAADLSMLELRIALKNHITGQLSSSAEGDLPPAFFHMAFVPTVDTRAVFASAGEYQTFDIHLSHAFLHAIGVSYALLDKFLEKVLHGQEPAHLVPVPYACTHEMLQLVQFILTSEHSAAGHAQMLRHYIISIVIAALEVVSKEEGVKLPVLTKADKMALHEIKEMIDASVPVYIPSDALLTRVFPRLNAFKLSYGFKRLFGYNPKEYYQRLRFAHAQELLEKGMEVGDVALAVNYESATPFIAAFKERFGITPKQWQKK